MKTNLVPQDISLKHEEEWQAVRTASEKDGKRESKSWNAAFAGSKPSRSESVNAR
jgi:hypothetical protein